MKTGAAALTPELTLVEAQRRLAAALRGVGIVEAASDARLLLLAATRLTKADFVREPERPLGSAAERLSAFAARRLAREPVSRILGMREFWGLDFELGPDALDPRPESECVVEAALACARQFESRRFRILDLGVGSGALLCALLRESPLADGLGLDVSPRACELARRNAARLGLAKRADIQAIAWEKAQCGRFEIVVANPPYIPSADIVGLDPEVARYDPMLALDGGADGLDSYRSLMAVLPGFLTDDGVAILEIGAGQADAVAALLRQAGFATIGVRDDLAGRPRVALARRQAPAAKMDQRRKSFLGGLGAEVESR